MESLSVQPQTARFGNEDLYLQMHEDALMLIESLGVKVSDTAAKKIMAALDPVQAPNLVYSESDGRFFVTRDVIDDCLDRVSRNRDYWPEGFGTGGMAAYIVDTDGPRAAELDDMKRLAEIYGQTDELTSLQASFNVCNRIKKADIQKRGEVECAIIDHMVDQAQGKLITPTIISERGIDHLGEYRRQGRKVGAALSIISTYLTVSDEMVDPFLRTVQNGIPYIMNSMPIGGLTGPFSMTALTTQAHAEALFGLILGQLVNPGIPAINSAMPTIADLGRNDMPLMFGSRANTMLNILIAELNIHLGLPCCQSACGHSRDSLDDEARKELAETYTLVDMYPHHVTRHLFGFASQLNDFSIDNLLKEIELYREIHRNPVEVVMPEPAEYDPEGVETIIEGFTRGDFRNLDHTLKNVGRAFNI
jgi:trimethylamine--corrinoid protein Co-methyltransferase